MTVSIIIAVKTWQKNLEECVNKCLELEFPNFEILVLPDTYEGAPRGERVKIIPTGCVNPARKRDEALKYAKGDLLAFIDDDAYPVKTWLQHAVEDFNDPQVAAVAGPAITPESDNPMQKASGLVYQSSLVSGKYIYRYLPKKRREVDDYPSCNFLVRKSVMQKLGGFNTNFWPGEDTKLCLDITKRLKQKIVYDPRVLVYHHRRPLFLAHIRQIASYALHRGYFVKRYPETSLRLPYFIPTLFLSGVLLGAILSCFIIPIREAYLLSLLLYLTLVFIFSICRQLRLIPLVFCGIILTHIAYGFNFLLGLVSKSLKEEEAG
jgi:cellulose synthase/poly-beta-1,6-N-acetylglucosamine synthase-like glycosyltransferase